MNVRESVLDRAKNYMENKDYSLERVQENKIKKPKMVIVKKKNSMNSRKGTK